MDVEKYYKYLQTTGHNYGKCQLHYCHSWDGLPVCKHDIEWTVCTCTFEENKKATDEEIV